MTEWITTIVEQMGYWAIALLMLLENVFPPIPSEVIMPLAGYTAANGGLNIMLVIMSGTIGTVSGAAFWWWLASKCGELRLKKLADRHGRWLTLSASDIDKIDDWFDRHGSWAIPVAHVIPGLRTLISIPAGLFGTTFPRFIILTILGSAVWTSVLAGAGYFLGRQFRPSITISGLLAWRSWRQSCYITSTASSPLSRVPEMLEDDLPVTLTRLGLATFLGLVLGFERERHGHDAGLRTHGLVALSSGMLTLSALELVEQHGEGDPVRVIQGLAQAIGFIAGGLIFVRGGDVRNMTTAASLWMAAAVGITAGAGQYILVLAGTGLALLLLVAASLVERILPKNDSLRDSEKTVQMPNRRGSAAPPSPPLQLSEDEK